MIDPCPRKSQEPSSATSNYFHHVAYTWQVKMLGTVSQISGAFRRTEIRCDWNLKKDQNRGKIWEKFSQVIDFTSLSSLIPRGKLKGRKR